MSALMMPPQPTGTVREQLLRQYSYLFQMAQQLNLALEQLEQGTAQPQQGITRTAQPQEQQYRTLKSMVIQTAQQVRQEMDRLAARLEGEYVAVSDFGTYVERLNNYIEANPDAITQYYSFSSALQADIDAVSADFDDYRADTQGYIRTGIVYYDGAVPVYGVAVGQNLTATEVDGEPMVDQNNFRATFTARKLSFWQDTTEVAYVSDNQLYITNITVLQQLTVGKWKLSAENGLAFRWIGG
ncbi:MAG: hypothetical protein J6J83_07190 [Oscillospiraceae bacterium]|nr:hypothetical protein [Oscillospiraceae bacterium]